MKTKAPNGRSVAISRKKPDWKGEPRSCRDAKQEEEKAKKKGCGCVVVASDEDNTPTPVEGVLLLDCKDQNREPQANEISQYVSLCAITARGIEEEGTDEQTDFREAATSPMLDALSEGS